jgi:hypothetical protein
MSTDEYSPDSSDGPGHDSGHPPAGLSWSDVVEAWRRELGGWTPLAEELMRRAGDKTGLPSDLGSIERGLRRLATRGQREGGQYGRWLDRFFGMPTAIESFARWLGQYHRRFADLPVSLCKRQLALWDRPPLRDCRAGAWIDLGVASVAMREHDRASVDARLARAATKIPRAGTALLLEHRLFSARVASDDHDDPAVARFLDEVEAHLDAPELGAEDRACYRARHLDALAYQRLHPQDGVPRIEDALAHYEAIPEASGIPFVDFRRALGRAYCFHRMANDELATELALAASEHAADGGFVRLRVMALNLASRTAREPDASNLRDRARRLSELLEDEDLLARVERPPRQ